jgi:integrase
VSSHTCRRTFCTLKFLKGMPAQAIMKFTGHTSERNFLKYLKLDAELTAQKYRGYF